MRVKEESEKASLKLNIKKKKKPKIMAFSPIISWQIGEKVEVVTDFIFLGSKITKDGNTAMNFFKTHLLLGKKARQCTKKQRYYFTDKGL